MRYYFYQLHVRCLDMCPFLTSGHALQQSTNIAVNVQRASCIAACSKYARADWKCVVQCYSAANVLRPNPHTKHSNCVSQHCGASFAALHDMLRIDMCLSTPNTGMLLRNIVKCMRMFANELLIQMEPDWKVWPSLKSPPFI